MEVVGEIHQEHSQTHQHHQAVVQAVIVAALTVKEVVLANPEDNYYFLLN